MSGIHGLLRFPSASVAVRDLERQARTMAHLGRDRAKLWHDGPVGLGHLLTQVTQEDFYDRQPVASPGGAMLVADLRLDNREELAAACGLDAATLPRMADSALLAHAYRRWGDDCAAHLVGDFVFAIWDAPSRTLVLGRDHMGQRPLFYHRAADVFVFASEPRGLWAVPGVPRQLSATAIGARMVLSSVPYRGATQFEAIGGLEGGTVMRVGADGRTETRRYWRPRADPKHEGHDDAYYVEAYRGVLAEAVACRVRRNMAPTGLFLGGGFDSGAIAALGAPAARKLIGISSVMPQGAPATRRDARKWVDALAAVVPGLDVRYHTREGTDLFTGMEAGFVEVDGVQGPNRYINDAMYRQFAALGVRVVMNGEGGDYTLNPRARRSLLRMLRNGEARRFLRELRAAYRAGRKPLLRLMLGEVVLPLLPGWLHAPLDRLRRGLAPFAPPMPLAPAFVRGLAEAGVKRPGYKPENRLTDIRQGFAGMLERVQSAPVAGGTVPAAYHGLTITLPFHDKRVIELALAIPERLHFRDGRDRYLARQALRDLLPPELLRRDSQNDDRAPDFGAMIRRVEPRMLADIDRMAKDERLARYFDFPRMRRLLTGARGPLAPRRNPISVEHAARSFQHARYIEWFLRDNQGGDDGA